MRILVIEDEPRILAFVSRGLEAEGFTVDAAGDGPDGLRRAVLEDYDLVVLDLLLPGSTASPSCASSSSGGPSSRW